LQTVISNVHALVKILCTGAHRQARLIAIDGAGGAGKSTLGAQLAAALDDFVHVDLDCFLIAKQDKFFDALRLDAVKAAVVASGRRVIMTGICLLRVLEAAGVRPDVLIYVKRMRKWGWADEDELEGDEIEHFALSLKVGIEEWPFQVEVRDYHRAYRPQDRATIVLERLEES
jgi:adenylate kinase family enzyme